MRPGTQRRPVGLTSLPSETLFSAALEESPGVPAASPRPTTLALCSSHAPCSPQPVCCPQGLLWVSLSHPSPRPAFTSLSFPALPASPPLSTHPALSPGTLQGQTSLQRGSATTPRGCQAWPPTCTGASSGVCAAPVRRPSRGTRRRRRPLGPSPGAGLLGSGGAGILLGGDSPSFSGGSFSALPGVGASVPWLPSSWQGEGRWVWACPGLPGRPPRPCAHLQHDGELAGAVVIAIGVQHFHEEPVPRDRPPGA